MNKDCCTGVSTCAKSVAYFLLGVVVGGLIFYITTLVATEFVQTSIFKYKSPSLTTTTTIDTTKLSSPTLKTVTSDSLVSEPYTDGN